MRLIYYSVAFTSDGKYQRQWVQSIRSLRNHNSSIDVYLFAFGFVTDDIVREAERRRVLIFPLGDYCEWMARRAHPRSHVIAQYPTVHRLLVSVEANTNHISRVLYVDCDTFFFNDPEILFNNCSSIHWFAREIPGSWLSPHGRTPNIDQGAVAAIVQQENLVPVPPFNTGVVLLNRDLWVQFAQLEKLYLDLMWRLMVGMQREGCEAGEGARLLRECVLEAATPIDLERALTYPSNNWWIMDEIACMLFLGHLSQFSQQIFEPTSVAQGLEFEAAIRNRTPPVVAHYFSFFEGEFFRRIPPIGLDS
jgi:hypothetical protein